MAPAEIVTAVTESGLRGRGGAAFPTGIKWKTVLDAPADAEVRHLQCRRRRLGHVLGSHAHGRRSLRPDRGHDDRGARRRRDGGLHLPARRVSACARGAARRPSRRPVRAAILGTSVCGSGKAFDLRGAARRRRVHLRRRDLDARESRGQARRSSPAAAAARDQGTVRPADHREQRHLAGARAHHPAQGRRVLSRLRRRPFARHAADSARRATSSMAGSSSGRSV